jgi:small subunit ribosomal protein S21
MPSVDIQEGSFDVALRRFKRACEKAGIPTKLRQMKRFAKKLQKEQETLDKERIRN